MNSSVGSVSAVNTPPIASFTVSPASGNTQTLFVVDASASLDLETASGSVEVRWDWESDGVWDTPWSTNRTASHRYGSSGTYTIRLEVRDGAGVTNETSSAVVVTEDSAGTLEGILAAVSPSIILVLAVVVAFVAGVYVMRRRRRNRDDAPSEHGDARRP